MWEIKQSVFLFTLVRKNGKRRVDDEGPVKGRCLLTRIFCSTVRDAGTMPG